MAHWEPRRREVGANMDRKRVTTLLAAVVVLVGFVGITSPSAPAAEPLSKAATALDKLPAAVLQAV